jgi:hypothetical protein
MTLTATLQAAGRDPAGTADRDLRPQRMGAMLFAVLAVAAQLDREYIREKTLEDQQAPPPQATTAAAPASSALAVQQTH